MNFNKNYQTNKQNKIKQHLNDDNSDDEVCKYINVDGEKKRKKYKQIYIQTIANIETKEHQTKLKSKASV